ncbi:DUF3862 domain-containing protein [Alteromonas sp. A079]|uniref:DUF3862 domain-containing protein n=1 Tax=Alteromonas sp. A079 TaxID=3410268 RepID=UPI003B9E10EC
MKAKLLLTLSAVFALAGCSKLTKENYELLEMGMSQEEVEAIIGDADNCGNMMGTTACTWGEQDSKFVKVVFMGDKAVTFSYEGLK